MAKRKTNRRDADLLVFRDIMCAYLDACSKSPMLAEGLALMPYRFLAYLGVNNMRAGEPIDSWIIDKLHETAGKYSEFGLGLSTPLFSVGVGAGGGQALPQVPAAGLGELLTAIKALKK